MYVVKHLFKLLRGSIFNQTILEKFQFLFLNKTCFLEPRSRPTLLPIKTRTSALTDSPVAIGIQVLFKMYLFNQSHDSESQLFIVFSYLRSRNNSVDWRLAIRVNLIGGLKKTYTFFLISQ